MSRGELDRRTVTPRRPAGLVAALLAGLVATLLTSLLAGCAAPSDDDFAAPVVGPAKIDVDTPALRTMKKQAGIEACKAGKGSNDLPAITLPCFGGGPDIALNRLEGPIVVSTWASWCGPCRKELPFYQRLFEEYAGRLDVVGIDYTDAQTEGAMDLLRDTGATFPQLADPQGDLAAQDPFPRMNDLPVVILVDADGAVAWVQLGEITSYDQLQDLVRHHLGVTA